jgi:hypothetical protein
MKDGIKKQSEEQKGRIETRNKDCNNERCNDS